jgi:hypothetical protein
LRISGGGAARTIYAPSNRSPSRGSETGRPADPRWLSPGCRRVNLGPGTPS